jgi:hypothetical protein
LATATSGLVVHTNRQRPHRCERCHVSQAALDS